MSRRELLDAVVVGGGIVGATMALALARDGRQVALVEAREPPRWQADAPDLRVYAFAPDNAALLDSLGVWRGVRETRAQPYRAMRVWDAAGGDAISFEADAFGRRELGWIVENDLLVDRLWSALPAAGVRLHCPERVESLSQDDSSAALELASGLRLRTRLVIAADGAQSALRAMAGIEVSDHDYGQRGLVAFVETECPHEATCWQRFLPTGPVALLPFGDVADRAGDAGHRGSIVWTLPTAEAARLVSVDEATFLREFEVAFGGRLGRALSVSKRVAFPLHRRLARNAVAGRVVLVGDAAHVVHPLAGQGANLGFLDAAALADVLKDGAAQREDPGAERILRRYERWRRSENDLMGGAIDAFDRLLARGSGRVAGLAQRGMPWVGRSGLAKRLFIERAMGLAGELPAAAR
jgi:2-octaprenyl-3-methyl-6-methoxy-1,4-benzoquinol hydroxylase